MLKLLPFLFTLQVTVFSFNCFAIDDDDPQDSAKTETEDSAPPSAGSQAVKETQAPQEPTQVETIVVYGIPDFCRIETMKQKLGRDYQATYGGLLKPGSNICGKPECEQKHFNSGIGHSRIGDYDSKTGNFSFISGYAFCDKNSECEMLQKKYTGIEFEVSKQESTPQAESASKYVYLKLQLNKDDLLDADFKNLTISCPENNCLGYEFHHKRGKIIYVETTTSGKKSKHLIVNLGIESKLVKTGEFKAPSKCEEGE